MSRRTQGNVAIEPFDFYRYENAEKCCSICGHAIYTANHNTYFCNKCYRTWKYEILGKEPWVIYLQRLENRRRYRKEKVESKITLIYLDNNLDIDDEGNLVQRD